MQKLQYRIIYGYNPKDYISIGEQQLEKALYAMISGGIYTDGIKTIKGGEIKNIIPDFRYYTKWYDTYTPTDSDDDEQMRRLMPPDSEFSERMNLANDRVAIVMRQGKPQLLNEPEKIDQLYLN